MEIELNEVLREFSTDPVKMTEGAKVEINKARNAYAWVLPMDIYLNPAWAAAQRKLQTEYGRKIDAGELSHDECERLDAEVFVETCLVTWQNVTNEPFSKPMAAIALVKFPMLRRLLETAATQFKRFNLDAVVEKEAKNSELTSHTEAESEANVSENDTSDGQSEPVAQPIA